MLPDDLIISCIIQVRAFKLRKFFLKLKIFVILNSNIYFYIRYQLEKLVKYSIDSATRLVCWCALGGTNNREVVADIAFELCANDVRYSKLLNNNP